MQETHAVVRDHVDWEIRRQKRYKNTKLHWQNTLCISEVQSGSLIEADDVLERALLNLRTIL